MTFKCQHVLLPDKCKRTEPDLPTFMLTANMMVKVNQIRPVSARASQIMVEQHYAVSHDEHDGDTTSHTKTSIGCKVLCTVLCMMVNRET